MTTHRLFHIEAAQFLAERVRAARTSTSRLAGRGWTHINDRDVQRETNDLHIMAQSGPYRMF